MTTKLRQISLVCLAAAVLNSPAAAQSLDWGDDSDFYGRGVHAYFAGRTAEADEFLSRALAVDPTDPRTFYFRALSRLQCGRTDEACADMQVGAALEAEQAGRFAIGSALQRVQGSNRLLLEKYRQQAQAAAAIGRGLSRARIHQRADGDAAVLRRQVVVPLDEFLGSENPRPLTPAELQQRAAAKTRTAVPPLPPQRPSAQPAEPEADPFEDDAAAARDAEPAPVRPVPPASTPDDSAPPAESAPPADSETPADSDEDPFGDFQ